jgi:phosphoribosylformylglycinamidine synthase
MPNVKTMVLRTAGTNCDYETVFAFQLAGSQVDSVHVNRLMGEPRLLEAYQILAIPGGFSYGDDVAAGKILANQIVHHLAEPVARFVEAGGLVIGVCNGFQVLVKAGLLPGAIDGDGQLVTLTDNDSGKFEDRWTYLEATSTRCVWFKGPGRIEAPAAHAEGKFVCRDAQVLMKLKANDQIVFRYVTAEGGEAGYPANPNGSQAGIAGICDLTGRVLGLMPHPERHVHGTQHPRWTREGLKDEGDGLAVFRNAVAYVKANA